VITSHHPGWKVTRDTHTGIARWTSPPAISTAMPRLAIGSEECACWSG
jgi:hypothetical protein